MTSDWWMEFVGSNSDCELSGHSVRGPSGSWLKVVLKLRVPKSNSKADDNFKIKANVKSRTHPKNRGWGTLRVILSFSGLGVWR